MVPPRPPRLDAAAEEVVRIAAAAPDWPALAAAAAPCRACPELVAARRHVVVGDVPVGGRPRFALVGEAPGAQEDETGRPFVGRSGALLDELLAQAGLDRRSAAVLNVVKCRPPGNRDPLPDEIAACAPYLERQIATIDPEVIVTLGRFSMARWFPGERISRIHGQPKRDGKRLIVPMYHPAAALHQGALRGAIEEDFAKLPKFLAEVERAREADAERSSPVSEQMSMF